MIAAGSDPGDLKLSAVRTFEQALADLPDGYREGKFADRRWGLTIRRSADGKRVWLYGEELGGRDVVSFNLYLLSMGGPQLRPCEMSSTKVIEFVIGFLPETEPLLTNT